MGGFVGPKPKPTVGTAAARLPRRAPSTPRTVFLGWVLASLGAVMAVARAAAPGVAFAAHRALHAALALPRIAAPRYVYIGRQIDLHPAAKTAAAARSRRGHRAGAHPGRAGASGDDVLVPEGVRPSPLSMHRMISYRARLLDLHLHLEVHLNVAFAV